jgi:hypothetical protein
LYLTLALLLTLILVSIFLTAGKFSDVMLELGVIFVVRAIFVLLVLLLVMIVKLAKFQLFLHRVGYQ